MEALEDVINAITEVLLVFQQAQSSYSKDITIRAEGVSMLMVEVDRHVAHRLESCSRIDDKVLRDKMIGANTEIQNASSRLNDIAKSQKDGIVSRNDYSKLHDELRIILQSMVDQVKITDQVNVGILMNICKKNVDAIIRLKKAPTSQALETVALEVGKLTGELDVSVRTRLAEITDPPLRERLEKALDTVKNGTPEACASCAKFLEKSLPQGDRDKQLMSLLQAMQEIINVIIITGKNVSDFLLAFNMPALTAKRPVSAMYGYQPKVQPFLTALEDAVRKNDAAGARAAAKGFAEEAEKEAQIAEAIAQNADPAIREQLLKDAAALRELIPLIQKDTEAFCANPTPENKLKVLQHIQAARGAINRIDEARKAEKALVAGANKLAALLSDLSSQCAAGDKSKSVETAKEFAEEMKRQVARGRAAAGNCSPARKKEILEACDELEAMIPKVIAALKYALDNPTDAAAQKALDDLVSRANALNAKITTLKIEDELEKNLAFIDKTLNELHDQVKRGDEIETALKSLDLVDAAHRRTELGRELLQQISHPVLHRQITQACDNVDTLAPAVVVCGRDGAKNPANPQVMGKLGSTMDEFRKYCLHITGTKQYIKDDGDVNDQAEGIFKTGIQLEAACVALQKAVKAGDTNASVAAAKDLIEQMGKQIALGRRLAAMCTDPAQKKKLEQACNDMERIMPQIILAMKEALLNPNDPAAQKKLDDLIERTRQANAIINDVANSMYKPDKSSSRQSKAMSKYDMFKADGTRDEIMQAAVQVTEATLDAQEPTIAEHKKILDTCKAIGQMMELLSIAAQKGNKQEMIELARKLTQMIGEIQAQSRAIAAKCKDQRLRDTLLAVSRVPRNFAVQLKIISAVKAASDDDDPTAEAQLVTCAKGLANSVIQTLKATEAASVACPK